VQFFTNHVAHQIRQLHTTHGFAKGLVDARLVTATTGSHLHRPRPAHDPWAVLIARIYEVFPLLYPTCGGHMRIIALITHSADIRQILDHIGVESEPPHNTPARGPPL
jgi:hypothetical protein